jgi:hypothetical protein
MANVAMQVEQLVANGANPVQIERIIKVLNPKVSKDPAVRASLGLRENPIETERYNAAAMFSEQDAMINVAKGLKYKDRFNSAKKLLRLQEQTDFDGEKYEELADLTKFYTDLKNDEGKKRLQEVLNIAGGKVVKRIIKSEFLNTADRLNKMKNADSGLLTNYTDINKVLKDRIGGSLVGLIDNDPVLKDRKNTILPTLVMYKGLVGVITEDDKGARFRTSKQSIIGYLLKKENGKYTAASRKILNSPFMNYIDKYNKVIRMAKQTSRLLDTKLGPERYANYYAPPDPDKQIRSKVKAVVKGDSLYTGTQGDKDALERIYDDMYTKRVASMDQNAVLNKQVYAMLGITRPWNPKKVADKVDPIPVIPRGY